MLKAETKMPQKSVTVPIINRNTGMFRSIALPLVTHANGFSTNAYALSIAEMFGASIQGFAFAFDPLIPVTGPFETPPPALIDELLARSESEARANATAFERQAERTAVSVQTQIIPAGMSEAVHTFAATARSFDLSIVPQYKSEDSSLPNFAEVVLFESGRPLIVVPYIQHAAASLKRVLVCWDGSRAAARAISDAWPILERAETVEVVTAGHENVVMELQHGLGQHFAQHGVNARLGALSANEIDIANAILSHAADNNATMIVMGGYGHNRMREWILGGVTRTILKTMTVPVLISH